MEEEETDFKWKMNFKICNHLRTEKHLLDRENSQTLVALHTINAYVQVT